MAKASVDIVCSKCGKTFTHQRRNLLNSRERENYEAWARANVDTCPECARAEQEQRNAAKAREIMGAHTLPDLTGSPKQIAWATTIRNKRIAEWAEIGAKPYDIIQIVRFATAATLWIDTRFCGARETARNISKEAHKK